MKSKSIRTTEEFLEAIRNRTEFASVIINKQEVKVPIFFSSKAMETYIDNYESTKDSKESFYMMLKEIINSHKNLFKENKEIQNITIEDIRDMYDADLKKIGEVIINQDENLRKFYVNDEDKSFFDNFNSAVLQEYNKFSEELKERFNNSFGAIEKLKKSISSVSKYDMSNSIPISEYIKPLNISDIIKEKPEIKSINSLLERQVQANEQIVEILSEEREINKMSNERNEKINKRNFILTLFTFIMAILSFIGFDRVYMYIQILVK